VPFLVKISRSFWVTPFGVFGSYRRCNSAAVILTAMMARESVAGVRGGAFALAFIAVPIYLTTAAS